MRLTLILLLAVLAIGCKNDKQKEAKDITVDLPLDFEDFWDRFHQDSLYQIEHINFPLQGIPTMMDSVYDATGYLWKKEEWVMHKNFESNEEFDQSFALFTEDMITERITHINGRMGMERRFAKIDDEWQLIYYAAMNFIEQRR